MMFMLPLLLVAQLTCRGESGLPFTWHHRDGQGAPISEMNELLEQLKTEGETSCESEVSAYLPNLENTEQCTAIYTVQQIKCKSPMSLCKGCSKNTQSNCVQQYVENWLPIFCNGGVSWNYHKIPSGCACYKLPRKKASDKESKGGARAPNSV